MSKEKVISDIKNILQGTNNEGFVFNPNADSHIIGLDLINFLVNRYDAASVDEAKKDLIATGAMEIADGAAGQFLIIMDKLTATKK